MSSLSWVEWFLVFLYFTELIIMMIPKTRRWVGQWFISTFLTNHAMEEHEC